MRWLYQWGSGRLQAMTIEAPTKAKAIKLLPGVPDEKEVSEVPDDYELCSQCGQDHEYDGPGVECRIADNDYRSEHEGA